MTIANHKKQISKREVFTIKLQYISGWCEQFQNIELWERIFTIPSCKTLEYLSCLIINIMNWDPCHCYDFSIKGQKYVSSDFLDLILNDNIYKGTVISCDITLLQLDLNLGDNFEFCFDYGDEHLFSLTVLNRINNLHNNSNPPQLISFLGNNIVQYPDYNNLTEASDNIIQFDLNSPRLDYPALLKVYSNFYSLLHLNWVRFLHLNDYQKLQKMRKANNKKHWQIAVALLESQKYSPKGISEKIEISENRIIKWIKTYNAFGLKPLISPRKRSEGKLQEKRKEKAKRVLEILHHSPSHYGINRSNWSLSAISQVYHEQYKEELSASTVGRIIKDDGGYKLRRAKKVLTSPDPAYAEKVSLLLSTLHSLKEEEDLFFIDEMGPIKVKKHGGKTYVKKGDKLLYSGIVANKGSVIFSAALSAKRNQVSLCYSDAKNSAAMIDLIEIIYNQYFHLSKIYITWDAASWHGSNELVGWLNRFNDNTKELKTGPIIEFIPLPSCSQFLDIIEAVFSAMKRAVIHLSNYQSVDEMKKAISLHFKERNLFFRKNPKRAGRKIWDIDFFHDIENLRSGNYREW